MDKLNFLQYTELWSKFYKSTIAQLNPEATTATPATSTSDDNTVNAATTSPSKGAPSCDAASLAKGDNDKSTEQTQQASSSPSSYTKEGLLKALHTIQAYTFGVDEHRKRIVVSDSCNALYLLLRLVHSYQKQKKDTTAAAGGGGMDEEVILAILKSVKSIVVRNPDGRTRCHRVYEEEEEGGGDGGLACKVILPDFMVGLYHSYKNNAKKPQQDKGKEAKTKREVQEGNNNNNTSAVGPVEEEWLTTMAAICMNDEDNIQLASHSKEIMAILSDLETRLAEVGGEGEKLEVAVQQKLTFVRALFS